MPVASPLRPSLRLRASVKFAAILAFLLPLAAVAAPEDDSFYSPAFGLGIMEGIVANASTGVTAVAVDSDFVYFGGNFAKVCSYRVNNIVRYHKKTGRFDRLGTADACGTNGQVSVIKLVKGGIYVGGKFSRVGVDSAQAGGTETGPIAAFDGKDWSPVGPKLAFYGTTAGAAVTAIEFDGSDTYIGGAFTLAGGDTLFNVARYKGGNKMDPLWEQAHLTNGVNTTRPILYLTGLRVTQSSVVVGGNITIAGGAVVNRVAQWNKNLEAWDGMKGGLDQAPSQYVADMDQDQNGKLYFAYKNVHRYDDTGWTILPGTEGTTSVNRFLWNTPFGSMMFGNGGPAFDSGSISFYDGNIWKALPMTRLGFTLGGSLNFAADDKRLWIGSEGGLQGAPGMAYWDGKQFGALGNGLRTTRTGGLGFNDFVEFEGKTIAAGSFSHLGPVAVEGVARWTGTGWEALGEGYQSVWRLAVFKGKLYACGSLNKPGKAAEGSLAVWTGTAWEIVPGFETNQVEAMAATDEYLYLGGARLGASLAPLARWNGTTVEEFGKELAATGGAGIHSIVPRKPGNICVAGSFLKVGTVATGGVACYEGESKTWTPMGPPLPSGVTTTALAAIGNDLYLGTHGNLANGAKNIGKWNGSEWAAFGGGLNSGVQRLVPNGEDLYVTGVFTKAGDVTVNGVTRWDGDTWSAFGSGVSPVYCNGAFVGPGGLWLGGIFTTAGGIPSRNVALYTNVEKKEAIPMGIVARGVRSGAKAQPHMRVRLQGVEFGSEGAFHKADGRAVPESKP